MGSVASAAALNSSMMLASPMGEAFDAYVQELQQFMEALPERARASYADYQQRKEANWAELISQCRALRERMPQPSGDAVSEALAQSWRGVADRLKALSEEMANRPDLSAVQRRHMELSRSFEIWAAKFRRTTTVRRIEIGRFKPLAAVRTAFHVGMALVAVVCYQFFLSRIGAVAVLGSLLVVFGTLEITRRVYPRWNEMLLETPLLKAMARPEEFHEVNSATYFLLALCAITPFFSREAVLCGILIIGFCDPAAAWVGKRYGKRKLYRRKSWVGSGTFVVVGLLVTLPYLAFALRQAGGLTPMVVAAALLASVGGAIAELFSTKLDDNLTVPIVATICASLLLP